MDSKALTYITVLALYTVGMLLVGIIINRKSFNNLREWALERETIGWFGLSMTTFATVYSAFTFVGLPGYFYKHGIANVFLVTVPACFILCPLLYFLSLQVIKLNKSGTIITPFELFIFKVKDSGASKWFLRLSIVALILFNLPYVIIQIAGVGKVLSALSENAIPYAIAALIMLVCMYIYASLGGMRGIILTDIFQGVYGVISFTILCFFFMRQEWGGFMPMLQSLKVNFAEYASLPGPKGLFTPSFIINQMLIVGLFCISFIQVFSRMLLFKNKTHAKQTCLSLFVVSVFMGSLAMFIGLGALQAFPGLSSGDLAIVKVIQSSPLTALFGDLFGALLLVGIFAGAMSTADSLLFTLGTIFTVNGLSTFPKLSPFLAKEKNQKITIKVFILVVLVLCYLLSLNPPNLIVDLSLVGFSGLTVLVPSFIVLLWRKAPGKHLLIGLLAGYTVFVYMQWIANAKLLDLNGGFVGFVVNALVLAVCMFVSPKGTYEARVGEGE
jgi:SSS family solute:Na+ symporter